MTVSIVVPAYNEKECIGGFLGKLKPVAKKIKAEIIVVDDGSSDGTAGIVKKKGVKLIQHPYNKGYGAALKTGIKAASGDTIAITDGDGTYPSSDIAKLVGEIGKYDMVIGDRSGSRHIPLLRRPAKWMLRHLAQYVVKKKIPDLNSGLRAFKKQVALGYFHLLPDKFSFTTTITLASLNDGLSVKFVPISYHKRGGKSKIRPFHFPEFMLLILRVMTYFRPLRIFAPAAVLLFLASAAVFFYSKLVLGTLMDVSVIMLFIASVLTFMLGLLADLIVVQGRQRG